MASLQGKFLAKYLTTALNGDLVTQLKTAAGVTTMTIKKLTLISPSVLKVNVNGVGLSDMFLDSDGKYKLSLDGNDVMVSSLITDTANISVYVAIVF